MIKWYVKLCGIIASFFGTFDNYSDEHHRFLRAGYKCPHCEEFLMKPYGIANVNCYDEKGQNVSIAFVRINGKYFECPKCKYQWNFRNV